MPRTSSCIPISVIRPRRFWQKRRDRFAVVLQPESQEIENVVVVAFGTQKKESVVASVSTVDPGKLRIPASNLTSAFAGQLACVIATSVRESQDSTTPNFSFAE